MIQESQLNITSMQCDNQIKSNLVSTKIPNPFTIITNEQFQEILDLDPLKLTDIKQSLLDDISMLEDMKTDYMQKLEKIKNG